MEKLDSQILYIILNIYSNKEPKMKFIVLLIVLLCLAQNATGTNYLKRPNPDDKKGVHPNVPLYNPDFYFQNETFWKMTIDYPIPVTFGFCQDKCLSLANQELEMDESAAAMTSFNVANDKDFNNWFCHCWGQKLNYAEDVIYAIPV